MKSCINWLLFSSLLALTQFAFADDRCDDYPIDNGVVKSCWEGRNNVCNGQGEHYDGIPTTETSYAFELCQNGRGCYVLFADDLFWFCRGYPDCDKAWHPDTYCQKVRRVHCNSGYEYKDDSCKKIIYCAGGRKAGEQWQHSITNGTKYFLCKENSEIISWVNCKAGYQFDGFGCYKYIP